MNNYGTVWTRPLVYEISFWKTYIHHNKKQLWKRWACSPAWPLWVRTLEALRLLPWTMSRVDVLITDWGAVCRWQEGGSVPGGGHVWQICSVRGCCICCRPQVAPLLQDASNTKTSRRQRSSKDFGLTWTPLWDQPAVLTLFHLD